MTEQDYFKEQVTRLLSEYKDALLHERIEELNANLPHALEIIHAEKELTIKYSSLEVIQIGQRNTILFDGNLYFLLNNSSCVLFCPQRTSAAIKQEFNELEQDKI